MLFLQFTTEKWLNVESTKGEIPFYVSEIFVALCYLKFMVSLHQKNKNQVISRDSEDLLIVEQTGG